MRKNPYKIYCYDKITKVSEYLKEMHRSTAEIKTLDCGIAFVDSETEKVGLGLPQTLRGPQVLSQILLRSEVAVQGP